MILFITGIGTDVGKSYATGHLARALMEKGRSVATQKFIQTGNVGRSEDIEVHRKLMGISPLPEDIELITSPIIYSYPASPDLAARIDDRQLDLSLADRSTAILASRYDDVLIEGAGGLMVPLCGDFLTIDYIASRQLPIALVTNGQLGSVSDTLLSLYAVKQRGIRLHSLIYNSYFDKDKTIAVDTRQYLSSYITRHFPQTEWMEI